MIFAQAHLPDHLATSLDPTEEGEQVDHPVDTKAKEHSL